MSSSIVVVLPDPELPRNAMIFNNSWTISLKISVGVCDLWFRSHTADRIFISSVYKVLYVKSKGDILDALSRQVPVALSQYDLRFIIVAGSVARDEQNWWSDIDVFVSIPEFEKFNGREKLEILTNLGLIFGSEIHGVEVRVIETLPLVVRFNIFKDGIILYEDGTRYRQDLLEHTLKLYFDFKPHRDRYLHKIMEERLRD